MTIHEALNKATKKLSQSTSPALDSEVLLSHLLDKSKEYLMTNPEKQISPKMEKQFNILLERRILGWPVAYLNNQKEFFGLKFYVHKNVLIPRPETEGLVELILSIVNRQSSLSFLDIGTGSGAIIISLAKNLPLGKFFASDISPKALVVAKKNAKTHQVQITFRQGSLLKPWKNQSFDIIVANLPYLAKQTDPSTKFEPELALVAKKKGLALYEELFKQFPSLLSSLPSNLFLEIGHDQSLSIKKLATKWLPAYEIKISKDLSEKPRYAVLNLN